MKEFIKKTYKIINNHLENPVHIAFAVDHKFINYAGISIYSILKNNCNKEIIFHIFTPLLENKNFHEFKNLEFKNFSLHIHEIDTTIFDNLPSSLEITTAMYYRLIIPEFLYNITEKVLYLDSDILCFNNFGNLFEIEFKNNLIAAVNDEFVLIKDKESLNIKKTTPYFNSGVILFNTKEWIKNDILTKFINLINKRKYYYPDQDVLNIILEDKVQFLTKQFNCFCQENIPILKDAIFVHYAGYPKPWSMMHHNNIDYLNYLLSSPWKDIPLVKPTNYKEIKKLSKVLLKKKEYIKFIYWYINYIVKKIKSDK